MWEGGLLELLECIWIYFTISEDFFAFITVSSGTCANLMVGCRATGFISCLRRARAQAVHPLCLLFWLVIFCPQGNPIHFRSPRKLKFSSFFIFVNFKDIVDQKIVSAEWTTTQSIPFVSCYVSVPRPLEIFGSRSLYSITRLKFKDMVSQGWSILVASIERKPSKILKPALNSHDRHQEIRISGVHVWVQCEYNSNTHCTKS